jgi:hypothetical protein
LTPRPCINLVLYYGVLGARSAWRARLGGDVAPAALDPAAAPPADPPPAAHPRTNLLWAQLMARSFPPSLGSRSTPSFGETSPERFARRRVGIDVLACPRCGDRFQLIALIDTRAVIEPILTHLGLPTTLPAARPARAPPLSFGADDEPA